jgi:GntR family transcriptional regulator, rspAB operon transcriptional repressor
MQLRKLKRQRATDEVYDALRQAILSSVFKPGERLQVEDIAAKLGVSLTPVRHAIQQLATEGLVEIKPRSGTYVAFLTPREVADTFEIRAALETLAAEKACSRITEDELARLKELAWGMRQPIETARDQKTHEEKNLEFHRTLIAASGNRKLAEMYESLIAHIKLARIFASENGWKTLLPQEQNEHDEIVQALEKRDQQRLIQVIRHHIERARDSLVESLRKVEPPQAANG